MQPSCTQPRAAISQRAISGLNEASFAQHIRTYVLRLTYRAETPAKTSGEQLNAAACGSYSVIRAEKLAADFVRDAQRAVVRRSRWEFVCTYRV